jgi:hypothetical protein
MRVGALVRFRYTTLDCMYTLPFFHSSMNDHAG